MRGGGGASCKGEGDLETAPSPAATPLVLPFSGLFFPDPTLWVIRGTKF